MKMSKQDVRIGQTAPDLRHCTFDRADAWIRSVSGIYENVSVRTGDEVCIGIAQRCRDLYFYLIKSFPELYDEIAARSVFVFSCSF